MSEEMKKEIKEPIEKKKAGSESGKKIKTEKNETRSYIFQFLMVFLGITAGFFVENIRENYIEGKRAEEYAGSLLNDLEEDTLHLNNGIEDTRFIVRAIDTFLTLINRDDINGISGEKLYYYGA